VLETIKFEIIVKNLFREAYYNLQLNLAVGQWLCKVLNAKPSQVIPKKVYQQTNVLTCYKSKSAKPSWF